MIGRAVRGPTDTPVTINSFGDFERAFGGLWADSSLGYAVRDFYLNGGSQAVIVRLFHPTFDTAADQEKAAAAAKATADAAVGADLAAAAAAAKAKADTYTADPDKSAANAVALAADTASKASGATVEKVTAAAKAAAEKAAPVSKASLSIGSIALEAVSEGSWANALRARIDHDVAGPDSVNLFNISVRDGTTRSVEVFRNVSVEPNHIRRLDKVLTNESNLVRVTGALPPARPDPSHDPASPGADVWADRSPETNTKVADAAKASDGVWLEVNDFIGDGKASKKDGLYALADADLFNILCLPPYLESGDVETNLVTRAAEYCLQRRAILLVDPPAAWKKDNAKNPSTLGVDDDAKRNAAFYFPRLRQPDPKRDNQIGDFVPCGAIAGIYARTDSTRGVWKAPAGLGAGLVGVPELSVSLNDAENGELNPLGVNCLRVMPAAGRVCWGARTLEGDDRLASEWKYIPVRRTALFIEESLYRGTHWVVFEPNDEPLWAQIRLNIGSFMHNLFRQGAFQGKTPQEAYFVKCDKETTPQNDINLGIVNIVVGFAPLKPAEFVIVTLQQLAGQLQT
nr:phage tail sheath C-terminal domain-containing protein [Nocardia sp. XZ_19_231]